jgi:cold shock CspA family protein
MGIVEQFNNLFWWQNGDLTMYGVVLWSDQADGKAVIWCEDHGDLAYFNGMIDGAPMPDMDAGDLVHFDLWQDARVRRASNLQLVGNQHYAGLADGLVQTTGHAPQRKNAVRVTTGRVISFAAAAQRRMADRRAMS